MILIDFKHQSLCGSAKAGQIKRLGLVQASIEKAA